MTLLPTALYGINETQMEQFFTDLPSLVEDLNDDSQYVSMLYAIEGTPSINQLNLIQNWMGRPPLILHEDVEQEILAVLTRVKYPRVALIETLLTIDEIDLMMISSWLHILKGVYPIYDSGACEGLRKLGLTSPFDPFDAMSYGIYVELIEALKEHAPAGALPESALPRQRIMQIGLRRFAERMISQF